MHHREFILSQRNALLDSLVRLYPDTYREGWRIHPDRRDWDAMPFEEQADTVRWLKEVPRVLPQMATTENMHFTRWMREICYIEAAKYWIFNPDALYDAVNGDVFSVSYIRDSSFKNVKHVSVTAEDRGIFQPKNLEDVWG